MSSTAGDEKVGAKHEDRANGTTIANSTSMFKLSIIPTLLLLGACQLAEPAPSYEGEGLPGARVESNDCPADNVCSPNTPDGLRLRSLSMPELPYITALGGTQSFLVESPEGEANNVEYTVELHSNLMEIVDSSPGQFTIRGVGTTTSVGAILSLRDATSGELLDQFRLPIKEVDSALLSPLKKEGFLNFGAKAAFVGSTTNLSAQLNSPDYTQSLFGDDIGEAISDEALQIGAAEDSTALFSVEQSDWNQGVLTVGQTLGDGILELQTGAGTRYEFPLQIVDSIDSIEMIGISELKVNTSVYVCGLPVSNSNHVIGVPLVFEISGPAEFIQDGNECGTLTMNAVGEALLTATGLGESAELTFTAEE